MIEVEMMEGGGSPLQVLYKHHSDLSNTDYTIYQTIKDKSFLVVATRNGESSIILDERKPTHAY